MSVGDGPRTGDETRRFRAFYDHAAPVEFDADLSRPREWAAVEALAERLESDAFDPAVKASPAWRERAKNDALVYASRAITAGYRRVVEDDATVRRVENVLAGWVDGNGPQAFWTTEDAARAAVRALLDGGAE